MMKLAVYALIAACLCLLVFCVVSGPVLLSLGGDVRSSKGFQILNPFRNKEAERAGTRVLERLRAGQCRETLGSIDVNGERVLTDCSREGQYPIADWNLEAIGFDADHRTVLRYRVKRNIQQAWSTGPFWLWVSQGDNSGYRVSGYEAWY